MASRKTRELAEQTIRESEKKYRDIFDNAIEGIFQITPDARLIRANKSFVRMFGYESPETLISEGAAIAKQCFFFSGNQESVERVVREKDHVSGFEKQFERKDRSVFWGTESVRAVYDSNGVLLYYEGSIMDATERKEKEQAEKERKIAEAANRAKSRFLANMSHEFRTPLNAILGYAQILRRSRNLTAAQIDGLNLIHKSGHHLLTLINDVLDLAKVEAGKMELHPAPVGLPGFLDGVAGIMRMAAHQRNIGFAFEAPGDLPAAVVADERHLRQVLLNLLGNAVKFTNEGRVTLQVENRGSDKDRASLRFGILDTGIGMTSEELARIFRPFEQVGDAKTRAEGTGLGLAITRELVCLMGGEIHAESEPDSGSAFWFEIALPVAEEAIPVPRTPKIPEVVGYQGERRKVLIVDDTEENRLMLSELLEPLGFDVTLAVNGKEGLRKAKTVRPDLVLMDLVMPVMNGFEAVRAIREIPEIRDVPIIAISASVFDTDRKRTRVVGCQAFLPKPVDSDRLFGMMKRHAGIEWTYGEAEPQVTRPSDVSGDEIVPPPYQELEALYELTMFGDLERVWEKARQLEAADAEYAPFAHKVCGYAGKFEDEPILELLEQFMKP